MIALRVASTAGLISKVDPGSCCLGILWSPRCCTLIMNLEACVFLSTINDGIWAIILEPTPVMLFGKLSIIRLQLLEMVSKVFSCPQLHDSEP